MNMKKECKGCGEEISLGRQKVVPDSNVCMECELRLERFFKVKQRSVEDVEIGGSDTADLYRQVTNARREK